MVSKTIVNHAKCFMFTSRILKEKQTRAKNILYTYIYILYTHTNISLSQRIMELESVFLVVYPFDSVYLGTIKGNLL